MSVNMEAMVQAMVPDSYQASFVPEEKTSSGVAGKEHRLQRYRCKRARAYATVTAEASRHLGGILCGLLETMFQEVQEILACLGTDVHHVK